MKLFCMLGFRLLQSFGQKYCRLVSSINLLARLCISSDSNAPFSVRRTQSHTVRSSPKTKEKRYAQRLIISLDTVRDFIAVASLLWRNVETVHRTVSLSFSALLRNFFTPISGSSPKNKNRSDRPKGQSLLLARCKGLEPLAYWFVASHSIQLS